MVGMQSAECRVQNEAKNDLRYRTKQFALRVIAVCQAIPENGTGRVIGNQLVRSGTSVGAQYREATRSRSIAEFVSKMESGLQELEETNYWLELLCESGLIPARRLDPLRAEANELTAMFVASIKTSKRKRHY
jgi:four helix bundle protein